MMKQFLTICLLLLAGVSYGQKRDISVYVMLAEECPICNHMGSTLNSIAEDYAGKVHLFAVFPLKTSTAATTNKFRKIHHLEKYATVLDTKQQLARRLGAKVTPEVIVTNANGDVLYRGRINDAYSAPGKKNNSASHRDMAMAIDQALEGKAVAKPWPLAIGCAITFHS